MPIHEVQRITRWQLWLSFFLVLTMGIANVQANLFDRDPVTETQTTPVAVTEETLQYEGQPGAPAPSFKTVHDTGEFLVKDPRDTSEKITEETDQTDQDEAWHWPWLWDDDQTTDPETILENQESDL